jgi:hypothetical protein
MKPSFHTQMDLFASAARLPELIGSDRHKAVALLRALLMEAVANRAVAPPSDGEEEAGNE